MPRLRRLVSEQLTPDELRAIRRLLADAFATDEHGGFGEDDWEHALGGVHFVLDEDGAILAHAAVVERELHVDGRPIRTGYVEAVATAPAHQRRGHGSAVMVAVSEYISRGFELGALGTSSHAFYEQLGWRTWRGPSSVRTGDGTRPTPDEDGYILVLRTPSSPPFDLWADISCDWRPGDVW